MVRTDLDTTRESSVTPQGTQVLRTYAPAVDIYETADELVLIADVPGARSEGVDVQYERGTLTLNATVAPRRDDEETSFLVREYGVGNYHRAFEINDEIDANRITAAIDNGVLTVRMPKAEAVKPKRIQVKPA